MWVRVPETYSFVKTYELGSISQPKRYVTALTLLAFIVDLLAYRKVASSSLSRLVAHFWIFRLFMKGKFDAYVL